MILYKIVVTLLVINIVHTEPRLITSSKSSSQKSKSNLSNKKERSPTDEQISYRLPDLVKPKNYKIVLTPYFDNEFEKNFTFDGSVEIILDIEKEVPEIILHSQYLAINHVLLRRQDRSEHIETSIKDGGFLKDFKHIRPTVLPNLTGGSYVLTVEYKGELRTDVNGFYRTSYQNAKGKTTWLATTQFEPLGARLTFPCFDEPALKATFDLTIRHPFNYSAISNMPIKSSVSIGTLLETSFYTTPIMSTYLLAFVISDFQSLRANENFAVYARPDAVKDGKLALEVGQKILNFMESYTGIPYVFPKMDQVAIPGRGGAMENWGLILYRDSALLFNNKTKDGGKETIEIVAHEMAHQWFGNLVTPKWWKYVWLSEGFAKYFEKYISNQIKPEWRLMDLSYVKDTQEIAFIRESDITLTHPLENNVGNPTEIHKMFGHTSYLKGSAIVRMIHHFLGKDIFKRGLNIYLTKNKFKGVDSTDLIRAFNEAAEEYQFNIGDDLDNIMDSWLNCKGYPLVTVTRHYENPALLTIEQQIFTKNDNELQKSQENCNWSIPVNYATLKYPEFNNTSLQFWMQEPSKNVSIDIQANEWIIINKQQTGFYRVNYDNKNWQLITNHLNSEKFLDIHVLNRAQLLDDAFTFIKKGSLKLETLLHLSSYLKQETDYIALIPGIKIISWLQEHLKDTEYYSLFKENVLAMARNILKSTGFEESTVDTFMDKEKRNIAIHWACVFGDIECINFMKDKLEKELDKSDSDASDLDELTLCEGLRAASFTLWKKVFSKYVNAKDDMEQNLFISALGCSKDKRILQYYLSYTDLNDLSYNDILYIIGSVVRNSEYGVENVLEHLTKVFKDSLPLKYAYELFLVNLFRTIGLRITTTAQLDKFKAFEETQIPIFVLKKGTENAESNIKWLEDNQSALKAWKEGLVS